MRKCKRWWIIVFLAAMTLQAQTPTGKSKGGNRASSDSTERARIRQAESLQAAYKNEGRILNVEAVGPGHTTLELSSLLIMEGTHTLEAAQRETIACSACMARLKRLGFRSVRIRGDTYDEIYNLQ